MKYFIFLSVILFSCTEQQTSTGTTESTTVVTNAADTTPVVSSTCYMQVLKRDTMVASIMQNDDVITGKLTFDNFEKDGSSGPFQGKLTDGIIKGWYNFQSEGMQSVMEVWLKMGDSSITRGYGPVSMKGDTSYFADPSAVKFEDNQQMKQLDCAAVPVKYQ